VNKGYIVTRLRERGFSRRSAELLVNFILDEMAAALARGEGVELSLGTLKRVAHRHREQRGWYLNRITTTYKQRYTVTLDPSAECENLFSVGDDRAALNQ